MKNLLRPTLLSAILLLVIPMMTFLRPEGEENPYPTETEAIQSSSETSVSAEMSDDYSDTLKVLDFTSGQVLEIPLEDYVIGAVMAEMPASYHKEALKAQAVAARTYAIRQREKQKIAPDELLMGADISNDSTKYQAYFTPEQAKSFYGESYDTCLDIVASAVRETEGEVLFYDGEPIVAAFHSTSGGRTESAAVVWGSEIEYLVPVDCSDDEQSPAYHGEKVFSDEELCGIISAKYPDADFSGEPDDWIIIGDRSSSGTVTELSAGGEIISGTAFRSLLGLKSANFDIEHSDGQFTVTTKGNGHGVGMSQYGANAMANDGADYKEILMHFYTGAELGSMQR